MTTGNPNMAGLTSAEAARLQEQYGRNELTPQHRDSFPEKVFHIICEPMFLLLLAAAVLYFILGEPRDGAIMLIFVLGIISIDVIQEWKTDKTLYALKDLSSPRITVLRDGTEVEISSADLVPGDLMLICEGLKIPADGIVVKCNDLCVDESSLTGEAEGVWKVTAEREQANGEYWRRDYCYAGTMVTQGSAVIWVDRIGAATEYGKIGSNIAEAPDRPTPLEKQTNALVKACAVIAGVLFLLVGIVTYFDLSGYAPQDRITASILTGITLAMAMIPEEFPVILTVFLSMGAWRLAKKQSLVRRLSAVETLGAVSVLCVDKTGTITMNQMTVRKVWCPDENEAALCETMGLACETDPYDPMEKAMLLHCETLGITREHLFGGTLVAEYPFTNELKMMGHVWQRERGLVIAAKGSPEQILNICTLTQEDREAVQITIDQFSRLGLRVIAVAEQQCGALCDVPPGLSGCNMQFLGLVCLADPPRPRVKRDIQTCHQAGIRVVMITGDNGVTAAAIARQIGMENCSHIITGDMLSRMTDEELREQVKETSIFSRVIPEHKMRIVKAFQDNGEIVAMTGDGVNDAPALKYADIGIAMGKRGSEVSREAADLILMDDNFTTIVETVRDGRRILDNIRKAFGYVFTIHIPIACASLLAPVLGIAPSDFLLLPLHVVVLELIIDPTCSIVLERQPAETSIMNRKPRNPQKKLLTPELLIKSILQGLVIFAVSFGTYFYVLSQNEALVGQARAMGLAIIMLSSLFLVQENSSNQDFVGRSIKQLASDPVMWAINLGTIAGLMIILYTPVSGFLKLSPLTFTQAAVVVLLSAGAVLWYEIVKLFRQITAAFSA